MRYALGKIYEGYRRAGAGEGKTIHFHRWILGLTDSTTSQLWVNHKDWDGLNCADDNLEIVTPAENRRHRRLLHHPTLRNTSGARNVYHGPTGWQVVVASQYFGTFPSKDEAAAVAAEIRDRITQARLDAAKRR